MNDNEIKSINDTKEKVLAGLFWTFGERILAQGVSFILSIILARILLPRELLVQDLEMLLYKRKMQMNWIFLPYFFVH